MSSTLATNCEFIVFCNVIKFFFIISQILGHNTLIFVLNCMILRLNTCIVLLVPSVYLALGTVKLYPYRCCFCEQ